eukprot:jgi/Botrbrau1/15326/Bobra.0319s0012.1
MAGLCFAALRVLKTVVRLQQTCKVSDGMVWLDPINVKAMDYTAYAVAQQPHCGEYRRYWNTVWQTATGSDGGSPPPGR